MGAHVLDCWVNKSVHDRQSVYKPNNILKFSTNFRTYLVMYPNSFVWPYKLKINAIRTIFDKNFRFALCMSIVLCIMQYDVKIYITQSRRFAHRVYNAI